MIPFHQTLCSPHNHDDDDDDDDDDGDDDENSDRYIEIVNFQQKNHNVNTNDKLAAKTVLALTKVMDPEEELTRY